MAAPGGRVAPRHATVAADTKKSKSTESQVDWCYETTTPTTPNGGRAEGRNNGDDSRAAKNAEVGSNRAIDPAMLSATGLHVPAFIDRILVIGEKWPLVGRLTKHNSGIPRPTVGDRRLHTPAITYVFGLKSSPQVGVV